MVQVISGFLGFLVLMMFGMVLINYFCLRIGMEGKKLIEEFFKQQSQLYRDIGEDITDSKPIER